MARGDDRICLVYSSGADICGGAAALLTWDVAFSHFRTLVSGRWLSQTVFKVYRKCIRFIL